MPGLVGRVVNTPLVEDVALIIHQGLVEMFGFGRFIAASFGMCDRQSAAAIPMVTVRPKLCTGTVSLSDKRPTDRRVVAASRATATAVQRCRLRPPSHWKAA